MDKKGIDISDGLLEAEILAERINVLSDDLRQEYFDKREMKDINKAWMFMDEYYKAARIKIEMISGMAWNLEKQLETLQDLVQDCPPGNSAPTPEPGGRLSIG